MNNKSLFAINSLIVLTMLSLAAWAWQQIPDTQMIPVHYGVDGLPDRYGGKFEAILGAPLLGVVLTAIFAIIFRIEPRRGHMRRSQKAYFMTGLSAMTLLLALHTATILQALGRQIDVVAIVSVGVGVHLAIIGNYLSKVRSNFSFGIRTPWTLSSERAWSKTHRLGGRLLFLLGIVSAIAAIANQNQLFLLLILGGTIGITVLSFIYSYVVWKSDPRR